MKNSLKPLLSIFLTMIIVFLALLPVNFIEETGRKENCEPIYPYWVTPYMSIVMVICIWLLLDFVKKYVDKWIK